MWLCLFRTCLKLGGSCSPPLHRVQMTKSSVVTWWVHRARQTSPVPAVQVQQTMKTASSDEELAFKQKERDMAMYTRKVGPYIYIYIELAEKKKDTATYPGGSTPLQVAGMVGMVKFCGRKLVCWHLFVS